MNALANPDLGKYLEEHFVSAFQRVGTFKIVGKQKQGGNVAAYFCAADGRVLHAIAGPVDAATMLREAKWVVEFSRKAIVDSKGDGAAFKAALRKAHAEKLRTEHGLVVEPHKSVGPADPYGDYVFLEIRNGKNPIPPGEPHPGIDVARRMRAPSSSIMAM